MDKYFQFILPRHGGIQFLNVAFIRQQHKSRQSADKKRQQGEKRRGVEETKDSPRGSSSRDTDRAEARTKAEHFRNAAKREKSKENTHSHTLTHIYIYVCADIHINRLQLLQPVEALVRDQGQLFALSLSVSVRFAVAH